MFELIDQNESYFDVYKVLIIKMGEEIKRESMLCIFYFFFVGQFSVFLKKVFNKCVID